MYLEGAFGRLTLSDIKTSNQNNRDDVVSGQGETNILMELTSIQKEKINNLKKIIKIIKGPEKALHGRR